MSMRAQDMEADTRSDMLLLKANPVSQRNAVASPLLRLPGELRNRIYVYVFKVDQIRVREDNTLSLKLLVVDSTPPAGSNQLYSFTDLHRLTFTCRQFQIETKLLPYTLNVFTLPLWAFRSMIRRSPEIMQNSVQILRVHTGGYAAEKDEEAFLRQMEQMDVLNDMPLVKKVAVTTFHGVQLSERSLQRAKGKAKRFTGRDIEFVNF